MCFLVPPLLTNRYGLSYRTRHSPGRPQLRPTCMSLWGVRAGSQGTTAPSEARLRAEQPEDSDSRHSVYIYNSRGQNHIEILIVLGIRPQIAKPKMPFAWSRTFNSETFLGLFYLFIYTPLIVKKHAFWN